MQKLLAKFGRRWLAGLCIVAVALCVSHGLIPTTLIERLDTYVYDMRLRTLPRIPNPQVVIVDIDEKSIAEVGRFPWSRNVLATLVDNLCDVYSARAVGFDILFSEPDTSSGYDKLEALANNELKDVPAFADKVHELRPALDYDALFAKSLANRPVVLGFYLANEHQTGVVSKPAFRVADLGRKTVEANEFKTFQADPEIFVSVAAATGYINGVPDDDGLYRSTPLLAKVGDGYYESLALATLRVALRSDTITPIFPHSLEMFGVRNKADYGALDSIELNSKPKARRIPVERELTSLIQYRGPGGPKGGGFEYLSAVDVIKKRVPPEKLMGKIVFVGTTAAGLKDLRATPVNADYPGVEIHANVVASILEGRFMQRPDFIEGFDFVQIILVGLTLAILLPRLSPMLAVSVTTGTIILVAGFNTFLYGYAGYVMPLATILLMIVAMFVLDLAWGYFSEFRHSKAIVNLFGEYVAPELVAEMAEDPEAYNMEGEIRDLTIMFADVRNFTTISESLEPNALREYINKYLTAMSEDIRGNRGTLDKYIGDCVMAFWGAPVRLPNHASLAVSTALRMQATAARLDAEFVARQWPSLKIGIGLNTGDVRVGDMGSAIRRAYTVMGDPVNLASRLEGITKEYGVGIVVGEGTRAAAPEFAYRELDKVRVKGKNEPVSIFEPLGIEAEVDPKLRAALKRWHLALRHYRKQQWDDAELILIELLRAYPNDKLYKQYSEDIGFLRANPPGENWDGVRNFKTK